MGKIKRLLGMAYPEFPEVV